MLIAETFLSLQGEGLLAGVPSFFIRTTGCNLRCRWCDTPNASWLDEGTCREVDSLVSEAGAQKVDHVVITGGEPLLQPGITELTRALRRGGLHITLETAGSVDQDFCCDLLSLSPKTANSDPPGRWRERHRSLRRCRETQRTLLRRFAEHQLKFVVRDSDDMPEVLEILGELGSPDPRRVLLMPEGRIPQEVAERAQQVAALCIEHNFRYTPRLHLDLFGGARGC